ncbi:hypothetical protein C7974DRAFT_183332 [Boeremia exigua]|uniref:uncharacterized protein n=1 Tax=Boeremia exigua TaxID=749465 RepID=UPI001E8D1F8D|nr:uncharacterized protein C7974DRAFT_183332 [Boeremia exigua]KAH6629228.1 hypothetical protein C7974DRAFT_183332 [Boeremia exigua]
MLEILRLLEFAELPLLQPVFIPHQNLNAGFLFIRIDDCIRGIITSRDSSVGIPKGTGASLTSYTYRKTVQSNQGVTRYLTEFTVIDQPQLQRQQQSVSLLPRFLSPRTPYRSALSRKSNMYSVLSNTVFVLRSDTSQPTLVFGNSLVWFDQQHRSCELGGRKARTPACKETSQKYVPIFEPLIIRTRGLRATAAAESGVQCTQPYMRFQAQADR